MTTLRSSTLAQVSAASITAAFPAGATAGDLLLIFVHGNYAPVATPPTGWGYANRLTGSFFNGAVLTKIATSGDISAGSVVISMEGNEPVSAVCFAIADPGDYLLTLPFAARYGTNPGTNPVSPAFDADSGDILLYGAALRSGSTIPDISRGATVQSIGGNPSTRTTAETLASPLTAATVTYSNTTSSGAYFVAAKIMPRPAPSLTAYSNAVLADSPLAYYRLGDTTKTGTTAIDISGSKRDGFYVGAPALGQPSLLTGDSDTAVRFTSGKYLLTPTTTAWNVNYITLSARIKVNTTGTLQDIMKRDDGGSNRVFIFRIDSSNRLDMVFWDAGGTLHQVTAATSLSLGTTYSIAATFDGSTAKLLLDGVVDGSLSFAGTLRQPTNGQPIQVAGSSDITIDEAAALGTALADTRLAAYHTAATTAGGAAGSISLTGSLPAIQESLTLAVRVGTTTTNRINGRRREGIAYVSDVTAVEPLPANLARATKVDKAFAYPTPTLVDGRPT